MSTYNLKAKNKETGEIVEVTITDTHYGMRYYVEPFNGLTKDAFYELYETISDELYEVISDTQEGWRDSGEDRH